MSHPIWSMYCFIFLSILPLLVGAGNILVISPSLSPSLLMAMGRIADTLAETGRHNVTVWIPEMRPLTMNGTRLAHRVVRTENVSDAFERMMRDSPEPFDEGAHSFRTRLAQDDSVAEWCEALLKRKDELDALHSAKFDLVLYNLVELCLVGVAHHLDIPRHIWVSTGPMPDPFNWFFGIPQPLSIVPTLQSGSLVGPRMGPWERVLNIWEYCLASVAQWRLFRAENSAFRRHISPDFPALEELASTRVDLAFVYGDQFVGPALPTLAKVINIGGLGVSKTAKPLDPALLRAVESGPRGAVLLSFGSNTDTAFFDQRKLANLYRAFANFPDIAFIVKAGSGDTFSRNWTRHERNIHLFEWVAQTDLLAHPALRVFISHAGANSILESAIRGIPVLAIPLFFDQLHVAKSAEYRGFARVLTKQDLLDEERIKQELEELLENPKYKTNALRVSKLHREKPGQPEEEVIRWTEFLLANGPLSELIPESARMAAMAYFCADIALIGVGILIGVIWMCRKMIGWAMGLRRGRNGVAARPRRPAKRLLKRD